MRLDGTEFGQFGLDQLWASGLAAVPLALCVWLLCRFCRIRPATRHMLWVIVLVSLVTPMIGGILGLPRVSLEAWLPKAGVAGDALVHRSGRESAAMILPINEKYCTTDARSWSPVNSCTQLETKDDRSACLPVVAVVRLGHRSWRYEPLYFGQIHEVTHASYTGYTPRNTRLIHTKSCVFGLETMF